MAYIEAQRFDEVVIECSPFIRTVQTASLIAKEIGYSKPIKVQYRFCEWLNTMIFQENPFPTLNVRTRP